MSEIWLFTISIRASMEQGWPQVASPLRGVLVDDNLLMQVNPGFRALIFYSGQEGSSPLATAFIVENFIAQIKLQAF